jgi:hypothetical protein
MVVLKKIKFDHSFFLSCFHLLFLKKIYIFKIYNKINFLAKGP